MPKSVWEALMEFNGFKKKIKTQSRVGMKQGVDLVGYVEGGGWNDSI